ncbi:MAG: helix-turn-helix domain-containing protein [Gemmiger sp.]|uniref:helix-turn-helix domain-containing protein n=1 Tax=Gemmiger sp. TaxID=2049027 RepID=UPI002E78F9CE|nr:helix-turn-helix domain-containing protein [Gemmiger sp.]MEE0708513.1 helix-turn-helix domain-containing protein [Gemmiger sp.]
MNEIMTVREAAKFLRTTCQQVRKMIQNEELPAVKVGREWRIPMEGIKLFLENNL